MKTYIKYIVIAVLLVIAGYFSLKWEIKQYSKIQDAENVTNYLNALIALKVLPTGSAVEDALKKQAADSTAAVNSSITTK